MTVPPPLMNEMVETALREWFGDKLDTIDPDTVQFVREDFHRILTAALTGRHVVTLPDPDEREDFGLEVQSGIWRTTDRSGGTREFISWRFGTDPYVFTGLGPQHAHPVAVIRAQCLAGLAACVDAERLAEEDPPCPPE